jgi:hypothetical protein
MTLTGAENRQRITDDGGQVLGQIAPRYSHLPILFRPSKDKMGPTIEHPVDVARREF